MNAFVISGIVIGCVLFVVLAAVLFYYAVLPKIVLHKMRTGEDPGGGMTYPENFEELKARTRAVKDLAYPSAYPQNGYNLYLPLFAESEKRCPLVVWVHGGGFIAGSKDGGDNVMTALCSAGYAVASIDYAVAPEHKYPTAVRQIAEFFRHLPDLLKAYPCIDGSRVALGGDSAGAQLAAQYAAAATNPAFAGELGLSCNQALKAVVLVCGPFNLPALRAYAQKTNKMFRRLVDMWGRVYFGKLRWYRSQAAAQTVVAEHVTRAFPPAFLTDGNKGSFEAQNRKLAEKLAALGVPVEELYFPESTGDVPHEYLFHLKDETAGAAMSRITDFLKRYC